MLLRWSYCCYWVSLVVTICIVLGNWRVMEMQRYVRPLGFALVRDTRVIRPESMVFDRHLCYFLLRRGLLRNNQLQPLNVLTCVNLVLDWWEGGVLFLLEIVLVRDVLLLHCASFSLSFCSSLDWEGVVPRAQTALVQSSVIRPLRHRCSVTDGFARITNNMW